MHYKKDKNLLVFYIGVCIFVATLPYIILLYKGITCDHCVFDQALELGLYFLPISILFTVFAIQIYRNANNKIQLLSQGLLVEDFSKICIEWDKIKKVEGVVQRVPRAAPILWMVISTTNDLEYMNGKVKRMNKILGINGIPVTNLNVYSEDASVILENIERHIKNVGGDINKVKKL